MGPGAAMAAPKVKKVDTVTTVTKVKKDIIYKKSQSKTLFILLILI